MGKQVCTCRLIMAFEAYKEHRISRLNMSAKLLRTVETWTTRSSGMTNVFILVHVRSRDEAPRKHTICMGASPRGASVVPHHRCYHVC